MNPALPRPPLNSEPKCLLYRSFKDLQGWQLKNFPDQSVQILNTSFMKKYFLIVNLKFLGMTLDCFLFYFWTVTWGKRTSPLV